MVHTLRMIISGKGEKEDIKVHGVHSYLHIDEESKEYSKKLSWFGRPQENPDGPRELRNSFQFARTRSRFKLISARPYQEIKAIKQTRIFSLFLPLGRTSGTVTVILSKLLIEKLFKEMYLQ